MFSLVVASLSMAMPVDDKFVGVLCNGGFTSCSKEVSTHEAKVMHIKHLKDTHGLLASDPTCTGKMEELTAGVQYSSTTSLYLVPDQEVNVKVEKVEGNKGVATISGNGLHKFECPGVAFERGEENEIVLKDDLSACDKVLAATPIKGLKICPDQNELHAVVSTVFADIRVVAKAM